MNLNPSKLESEIFARNNTIGNYLKLVLAVLSREISKITGNGINLPFDVSEFTSINKNQVIPLPDQELSICEICDISGRALGIVKHLVIRHFSVRLSNLAMNTYSCPIDKCCQNWNDVTIENKISHLGVFHRLAGTFVRELSAELAKEEVYSPKIALFTCAVKNCVVSKQKIYHSAEKIMFHGLTHYRSKVIDYFLTFCLFRLLSNLRAILY